MGAARILIVEDDPAIVSVYFRALQADGYELAIAFEGTTGLQLAEQTRPDLILLDISMPDVDGLTVCRALRAMPGFERTPIVFVTAHAGTTTRVEGLEIGGDDYVVKPFEVTELRARIRALLRRSLPAKPPRTAGIQLNKQTNTAMIDGRCVHITGRSQELLSYFLQHEGIALTSNQLIRAVWGCAPEHADPGILRWQVRKLRQQIEPNPKAPRYIHTVKQRGYLYRDAEREA